MEPHYEDDQITLYHGDCIEVLRTLPDNSVDSVVTDPPYGLEFMGKDWDAPWKGSASSHAEARTRRADEMDDPVKAKFLRHGVNSYEAGVPFQLWCEEWARECYRVLKPGGHILAFGGTRTFHRMTCAIEDSGFVIRDSIAWLYGQGFPKSRNVGRDIDRAAGVDREDVYEGDREDDNEVYGKGLGVNLLEERPVTEDAQRWQGWGTALRPAFEPIVMARKPFPGPVYLNVLKWGTGAINVGACRIGTARRSSTRSNGVVVSENSSMAGGNTGRVPGPDVTGRWPANVAVDASQAEELDTQSGVSRSTSRTGRRRVGKDSGTFGAYAGQDDVESHHDDEGGASRFVFVARDFTGRWPSNVALDDIAAGLVDEMSGETKSAGSRPRSPDGEAQATWSLKRKGGVQVGHDDEGGASRFFYTAKAGTSERPKVNGEMHPTVKPRSLMQWLIRMVTPPGGVVLEPFAGSGTTVEAAHLERVRVIAIEKDDSYLPLILSRIYRQKDPVEHMKLAGEDLGLFDL